MAAAKKVTRKELLKEPDEFLTLSRRWFLFVITHKFQFIGGVALVLLVALVISGYQYFSVRSENKAFAELQQIQKLYLEVMNSDGPTAALQSVEEQLAKLVDKYDRNSGGKTGRVLLANASYQAGKYDRAMELYEKALQDFSIDPTISAIIQKDLAYTYERLKDYQAAISLFERVAEDPHAIMKDEALFNLGKLYERIGKREKSLEAFRKLTENYEDSIYSGLVKEKLAG